MSQKPRVRRSIAGLHEDGVDMAVNSQALMMRMIALQVNTVRQAFRPENTHTVEICIDASRYGKFNFELAAGFTPHAKVEGSKACGISAMLPPLKQGELLWRDCTPGTALGKQDAQAFKSSGLRNPPGELRTAASPQVGREGLFRPQCLKGALIIL